MWTSLITLFAISIAVSKGERCTYTENCKSELEAKASNIGHDQYEYCRIINELDECVYRNKIHCNPETLQEIEHFVDVLFSKVSDCVRSKATFLQPSTILNFLSLFFIFYWNILH